MKAVKAMLAGFPLAHQAGDTRLSIQNSPAQSQPFAPRGQAAFAPARSLQNWRCSSLQSYIGDAPGLPRQIPAGEKIASVIAD